MNKPLDKVWEGLPNAARKQYTEKGDLGLAQSVVDNELIYKDFMPSERVIPKPEMLHTYEQKTTQQKMEFDKFYPDWRRRCGAIAFEEEMGSVDRKNARNYQTLIYYHELLRGDQERQAKINRLIQMYDNISNNITNTIKIFHGRVAA